MGGERTDEGNSRDGDGGGGSRSRSPRGIRRKDGNGRDGGGDDFSGREQARGGDEKGGGGGGGSRSRSRDRDRDRERDKGREGTRRRRGDDNGDAGDSNGDTDRVIEAKSGRKDVRGSRGGSRDRDGGRDDDGASGSADRGKKRSDHANGDRGDDGRTSRSRSRSRDRDRNRDRDRDRDPDRDRERDRDRDGGAKGGGSRRRQHSSRRSRTRDRGGSDRHRRRKRGDDRDSSRRRPSSKRRDRGKKKRRRRSSSSSSSTSSSSSGSSSTSSSSSGGSSSSTSSSSDRRSKRRRKHGTGKTAKTKKKGVEVKVANARLLSKLASRGETLEEREERRAKRRAERIASRFGYTPDDNPFNDPNLHDTFSWKKREAATAAAAPAGQPPKAKGRKDEQEHILSEIDKVRKRRADREAQQDEMERLKAEESRLRELENYDEWAAKEEEFHLQQQRQRSAIRLLEKREKPVDVLAKNLLLFGLTEEEKTNRAKVKYQERYDALAELDTLEAELVEPHELLKDLKLLELQELLGDIEAYRDLEREAAAAAAKDGAQHDHAASEMIIQYWDNLHLVTRDEIRYVQTGGKGGAHSAVVDDIQQLFEDKSAEALQKMKEEVVSKLNSKGTGVDTEYWGSVLSQLDVHRAKEELCDVHNMMLARQLEKLEKRKEALSKLAAEDGEGEPGDADASKAEEKQEAQQLQTILPSNVNDVNFGSLEESLGLSSEVNLGAASYAWQDKYRPRKPRYFNRVKTGYDWNKYNQTHYDHDTPPPKIVQGYKFNVFYPDLIDKTKTPGYKLERADTDEFCILRFHAGPPYEDVAFKIINREWNRSRKRGFRCTFERGVLSLYVNFKSHWYRR